ncbi:MAG: HD domain-containing protein [Archangium sp.]|nr:HD domain-containing protein [Archangium sp.]
MERFLVVDDDPDITTALTRVLESLGYEAVGFTDPLEAAKETRFDLVMSDFMMPQMNGVELLRALRSAQPRAVRLMLTAANDFKVAMDAVNRGEVFRLLPKPWRLEELKGAIQQAVDYFRLVKEHERLTIEVSMHNMRLTAMNATLEQMVVERTNGLLEGMIRALDTRDTETQWHSWRVAKFTRRIAEAHGVTGEQLVRIEQGALLHDIGKIGVRDSILLKPGPLTPEEWVEMKKHPELGYKMLAHISYLREAAEIVYQHQERYDGRGYPRGLKGEEITLGARIFVIADTMDAITSDRPYRRGSPLEVALAEIGRLAGTQFDPALVKTYLSIDPAEWTRIRTDVEHLEVEDRHRWGVPTPAPAPVPTLR